MGFRGDGRERELGEGFGDADDGFELPNGDGDRGAGVGAEFGAVDLAADGDEVGGELFGGGGGEAGGAATGGVWLVRRFVGRGRGGGMYDLQ